MILMTAYSISSILLLFSTYAQTFLSPASFSINSTLSSTDVRSSSLYPAYFPFHSVSLFCTCLSYISSILLQKHPSSAQIQATSIFRIRLIYQASRYNVQTTLMPVQESSDKRSIFFFPFHCTWPIKIASPSATFVQIVSHSSPSSRLHSIKYKLSYIQP